MYLFIAYLSVCYTVKVDVLTTKVLDLSYYFKNVLIFHNLYYYYYFFLH